MRGREGVFVFPAVCPCARRPVLQMIPTVTATNLSSSLHMLLLLMVDIGVNNWDLKAASPDVFTKSASGQIESAVRLLPSNPAGQPRQLCRAELDPPNYG